MLAHCTSGTDQGENDNEDVEMRQYSRNYDLVGVDSEEKNIHCSASIMLTHVFMVS